MTKYVSKYKMFSGQMIGRWTVIDAPPTGNVKCRCSCGVEKQVARYDLFRGKSLSCGCYRNENMAKHMGTHGQSSTKLYGVWQALKRRCTVPADKNYGRYGGRGIKVCDEWMKSFEAFAAHVGVPSPGMTLDRIDNDKGYEPGNVRWSTMREQIYNSTIVVRLEACGHTKTVGEWLEALDISATAFRALRRKHKDFMGTVFVNSDGEFDSPLIVRRKNNPRVVKKAKAGACHDN